MEHTTHVTDPTSGATQVELLTPAQLVVGQILTGQGWQTVRQVADISDGHITLLDLARPLPEAGHVHILTARHNTECASCGAIRCPIDSILPTEGFVRAHIIQPAEGATILVPDRWT